MPGSRYRPFWRLLVDNGNPRHLGGAFNPVYNYNPLLSHLLGGLLPTGISTMLYSALLYSALSSRTTLLTLYEPATEGRKNESLLLFVLRLVFAATLPKAPRVCALVQKLLAVVPRPGTI